MVMIKAECIEFDEPRKIGIASENGKKYELINKSGFKLRKIKIDNCIQQNKYEKRCDYLFLIDKNPDDTIAHFVELKGGAISDALKQILETHEFLKPELKTMDIKARIICSVNNPQIIYNQTYRKLFQRTKGNIKIASNKFLTETI